MMPKFAVVLLTLALLGCNDTTTEEPKPSDPPQPSTPPPEISSFTASASSIMEGETVTLLPVFSNGSGQIDNGVGAVTSDESVSVSPPASTTYTLTVTNDTGDSATASVDVTVEPSPITIEFEQPEDGQLAGDELFVSVTILSEFDITAASAEVEDRSAPLEFDQEVARFGGELSLAGLPSGPQVVTVTAEDAAGNVVSRQRSFMLDRPPILTVTKPLAYSVATPELPVEASCSDDLSDCKIEVWWGESEVGPLLASAEGELSQVLDLSEFNGHSRNLTVTAREITTGQVTAILRPVFVESSARLTNERQFSTLVADFDGERALLERTTDDSSELTIVDIVSGVETIVDVPENFEVHEAFLTTTGAIYAGEDEANVDAVYDWNNSQLFKLPSGVDLENVAGDYALWDDGTHLWRRKATSDVQIVHPARSGDVASNGVVVFPARPGGETHDQIVKFDGTGYTTLTADAAIDNHAPRTDGQGVVYAKFGTEVQSIAFHDGTAETILTTGAFPEVLSPRSDYAIAGGWVAFIELQDNSLPDVWAIDPSGTVAQRTNFSAETAIETLAPGGEVMVLAGEKRYLSLPDLPPEQATEISSRLGQSIRIGDTWYVSIGRAVFEVQ